MGYRMDETRRGGPQFTRLQKLEVMDSFKKLGTNGRWVPLLALIADTGIEDGRTVRAVMEHLCKHNPFPVPLISGPKGYRLTVSQYEANAYVARVRRTANTMLQRASIQQRVANKLPPDDPNWLQPALL